MGVTIFCPSSPAVRRFITCLTPARAARPSCAVVGWPVDRGAPDGARKLLMSEFCSAARSKPADPAQAVSMSANRLPRINRKLLEAIGMVSVMLFSLDYEEVAAGPIPRSRSRPFTRCIWSEPSAHDMWLYAATTSLRF